MRKDIEKEIGKEVSIHAIKMALSRHPKTRTIEKQLRPLITHTLKTITDIGLMTCIRSPRSVALISGYMAEKKKSDACFFTMIEGTEEIDLIYDMKLAPEIRTLIPESLHTLTLQDLAIISLHLSDSEIETPGIFYQLTKRLAFHGINIIQILSTYHELGIIVKQEDMKAVMALVL